MASTKVHETPAEKMAQAAKSSRNGPLPDGMSDIYNQVVEAVHTCAKKGMRGMAITAEIPKHLSDYCPHIVGDLRDGGFKVDIIGYEPTIQGVTMSLFITW